MSNRSAFNLASHSLDSSSLPLYSSRAWSRSGSLLPLMIGVYDVFLVTCGIAGRRAMGDEDVRIGAVVLRWK